MNLFFAFFWMIPILIQLAAAGSWAGSIHLMQSQTASGRAARLWEMILLAAAFLLTGWLFFVLANAPAFDFVNRCRPSGTGLCLDGRSYQSARLEILGDYALTALVYLILPLVAETGVFLFLLRRRKKKHPKAGGK